MGPKRRVLIVEDEAFVSEALADVVAKVSELELAGTAATLRDARAMLEQIRPDVVLADLFLDDGNSLELLRLVRQRHLGTRVIVVTGVRDGFAARDALAAGALGYVLKAQPTQEIIDALRSVSAGRRYVSPRVAMASGGDRSPAGEQLGLEKLSRREMEVLRLVVAGLTSIEIGRRLCVSPKTVDSHRSNMHRKLSLRNAVELIRFATANGIGAATIPGGRA